MRRRGAPLGFLGGVVLAVLVAGCAPSVSEDAPQPGPAEAARLEARDVTLELGGVRPLVLRAAQARVDDAGAGEGTEVQATLAGAPDGPPPLEIEAPRSTWDLQSRTVRFEGGVRAVRGPVVLTCDQLIVRYASADRVEEAVAEGSVVVQQGQRTATGGRAVLQADSGRVTLTEGPTLREGASTLQGERISLFLDDQRVTCEACRLVVAGDAVAPAARSGSP